jgi:hypothetical protein
MCQGAFQIVALVATPSPSLAPKSPNGDFGDPAEVSFRGFRGSRQIRQFELHPAKCYCLKVMLTPSSWIALRLKL